jgi:hypothetical protein
MTDPTGKQMKTATMVSLFVALLVGAAALLFPRGKTMAPAVRTPQKVAPPKPISNPAARRHPGPRPRPRVAEPEAGEPPRADSLAPEAALPPPPEDAIPGEYVFRFYDAHDRAKFEELARRVGARVIDSMAIGNAVRVGVADARLLRTLLEQSPTPIGWMPNIFVRVPEREDSPEPAPTTEYRGFGAQVLPWLGIADNHDWGKGVTVALLDSGVALAESLEGVDITHVDLTGTRQGAALHGTAVASLIAGSDTTVRGVAPGVDLLSVRVLSETGTGDAFTLAKGIIEAVNRGAQVINLCLGSRTDSHILQSAVQYAAEQNVLLVAAAGNDGLLGVSYPAAYNTVVAVGAVDPDNRHLYFSNRGPQIDIAAPGAPVMFSGTSASTPFVSGTAAALLAQDPTLTPQRISELLKQYSNDAGAPGVDDAFGAGVLDVGRLTSREIAGVHDMAVMLPHMSGVTTERSVMIDVSAQNRGTEPIGQVDLLIEHDGHRQVFQFFNVRVGETVTHQLKIPRNSVSEAGIHLRAGANLRGVADAVPGNNVMESHILIPEKTK